MKDFESEGGEVRCWVEDERVIFLKAVTQHGDPVELTGEAARALAAALIEMADCAE